MHNTLHIAPCCTSLVASGHVMFSFRLLSFFPFTFSSFLLLSLLSFPFLVPHFPLLWTSQGHLVPFLSRVNTFPQGNPPNGSNLFRQVTTTPLVFHPCFAHPHLSPGREGGRQLLDVHLEVGKTTGNGLSGEVFFQSNSRRLNVLSSWFFTGTNSSVTLLWVAWCPPSAGSLWSKAVS